MRQIATIFSALMLFGCAHTAAVRPASNPGTRGPDLGADPPTSTIIVSSPLPPSRLDLPDDRLPAGWMRLKAEPSSPGEIVAEFGHFPEDGYIRASTFDGEKLNEEDAARGMAAEIESKGGRVSPVDRLNGDGHHAAFNVLVETDNGRELHRILFRPTGRGHVSLYIIGIWPHAANAAMQRDFEAIAESLELAPAGNR